jgi:hypothetical protein
MTDASIDLEMRADRLRRDHLAAHDVSNALPWRLLKASEQARWIGEATSQPNTTSELQGGAPRAKGQG